MKDSAYISAQEEEKGLSGCPVNDQIAVACSGGVDSLAALCVLKNAGRKIIAFHALLTPEAQVPANLPDICSKLQIPFHVADLRKEFSQFIIEPYMRALGEGITPNPCAHCNKIIKFSLFLKASRSIGAEFLASGHYCSLSPYGGTGPILLSRAYDAAKDQGYFLALLEPQTLNKIVFPLAGCTKNRAREIVKKSGLETPIPMESQDICFISRKFFEQYCHEHGVPTETGPILLREENELGKSPDELRRIGTHRGVSIYTVGQRKGLGVPWREPLYVREIYMESNSLVLAPGSISHMKGCEMAKFNFFLPFSKWPGEIWARLRYRQNLIPCKLKPAGHKWQLYLDCPCLATAVGQLAVIYDQNGFILGGGIINRVFHT